MCELLIERTTIEKNNLIRRAKKTKELIEKYRKKYYKDTSDEIKNLIIKEMFKIEAEISSYNNKSYIYRNFSGLKDFIKEINFKKSCDRINQRMQFIERCAIQNYNYKLSQDLRKWIFAIQNKLKEIKLINKESKELQEEIEILETFKDRLYLTEIIEENCNYNDVKDIYEYASYLKSLALIKLFDKGENLIVEIGINTTLEEFNSCLARLDSCNESLRNPIIDYISDIKILDEIIEM